MEFPGRSRVRWNGWSWGRAGDGAGSSAPHSWQGAQKGGDGDGEKVNDLVSLCFFLSGYHTSTKSNPVGCQMLFFKLVGLL